MSGIGKHRLAKFLSVKHYPNIALDFDILRFLLSSSSYMIPESGSVMEPWSIILTATKKLSFTEVGFFLLSVSEAVPHTILRNC